MLVKVDSTELDERRFSFHRIVPVLWLPLFVFAKKPSFGRIWTEYRRERKILLVACCERERSSFRSFPQSEWFSVSRFWFAKRCTTRESHFSNYQTTSSHTKTAIVVSSLHQQMRNIQSPHTYLSNVLKRILRGSKGSYFSIRSLEKQVQSEYIASKIISTQNVKHHSPYSFFSVMRKRN